MPKFGKRSLEQLDTCDYRLQRIANVAIRIFDFSVVEGHRGEALQTKYFEEKKTKVRFPNGKHNKNPSMAFDLVPFPPPKTQEEWKSQETALRFHLMAGVLLGIAAALGYKARWGGDWNMNNLSSDESFQDLLHFEILE